MAINERLVHTASAAAAAGTGNQEEGLILHLDANDVDSYDGDGDVWYDIHDHEYTPATNVSEHFNTVTFTSTGVTGASVGVSSVGFQPDLVWIKARNYAHYHRLTDSVRGVDKSLRSSTSDAEQSSDSFSVLSFNSDGFNYRDYQESNETLVAWCFKAGGATDSTNFISIDGTSYTSYSEAGLSTPYGSPTQQLSVNTKLGFSVIFADNVSVNHNNKKLVHGLGVEPELMILKFTNTTSSWYTYHKDVGKDRYLLLNATDAQSSSYSGRWYADSTQLGALLDSTPRDFIVYSFISKRGVSKVGSYIGDGTTNNKIYTGFEPAFVMVKRTDSTSNWRIYDNKRGTEKELYANTDAAEPSDVSYIDFNRDGFTLTSNGGWINNSGGNFIYYAVAKNTNETGLIPDTDLELHLDAASFDGSTNTPSTWTALTGSNGTISGATFDSELGNHLNIASDSDYVDVPTANMLDSDFTIEMWYNINSTSSSYKMLLGGSGYSSQTGLGHYIYGDTLKTWVSISGATTNVLTSQSALIANTWHHIVLKREGSTWTQYVDGNEVGTATGTTSSLSSANSKIGRHYTSTGLFTAGKSGQVRIYSSALTQAQIRQNYNFTKPSYPNGYDGTISGASWNPSGYFEFNGSSHFAYISATNSSPVDFSKKNYSIAAWVNLDNVNTFNYVLSKYGTSDSVRSIIFGVNNNGTLRLLERSSSTNNQSSTGVLTSGTWHHIAVVRAFDKISFYINGSLDTEISNSFTPNNGGNQRIAIGKHESTGPLYFDGKMSDIKLYNKALTPSEVASQFAIKQFEIG